MTFAPDCQTLFVVKMVRNFHFLYVPLTQARTTGSGIRCNAIVPIHHHITVVNKLHLFVHRDRTEWLYHLELAPTISTVTVEEPVYDKVWKLISSTSDFWASPTIVHEESNQRPIFARLININLRPMAQDDVCFATFSEFFGGHFSHIVSTEIFFFMCARFCMYPKIINPLNSNINCRQFIIKPELYMEHMKD